MVFGVIRLPLLLCILPCFPRFINLINHSILLLVVCGIIILLWNLLLYVRYNFIFTPFNHNLSLGSQWNYGFEQAKISVDLVLNLHAVFVFLFVLEFPISLNCICYLFHFNLEAPLTRLNHYKFRSKLSMISICSLSLIMFQLATGKTSQIMSLCSPNRLFGM